MQLSRHLVERTRALVAAALLAAWLPGAGAQEFRTFNPITAPGAEKFSLPSGAQRMAQPRIQAVDRGAVERQIRSVAESWNTAQLAEKLGPQFYDRTRLTDVVTTRVPRDAKLRVLSVQGVQILDQHVTADPSGVFDTYVSRVSVTVRTQVEFNDPTQGFQRRDGTNEFILKVTQRALR